MTAVFGLPVVESGETLTDLLAALRAAREADQACQEHGFGDQHTRFVVVEAEAAATDEDDKA